jgi:hypothetical protein
MPSAATVTAAQNFEAAKAGPLGVRQEAVAAAQRTYRVARQAELTTWEHAHAAVQKRFDLLKSDPEHPDLPAATRALNELQQPSPRRLLAEMDRAIQQADREYHETLQRLRAEHGLTRAF